MTLADFQSAGIIPVSADLLKMWFRGPQSKSSRVRGTLGCRRSGPADLYTLRWFSFSCTSSCKDQYSHLNENILPKESDIHNYPTRNNNKFITRKCNMRKSEMSINFKSIKVYNKPPADIRTSESLNVFMDNLRTTSFLDTEFITDVFFILCDMLYLCVMCTNNMTIFYLY